ncbi:organic solute transporter Ostalpha-domain-containing protein [Coniella lustricola]|uniref:Organic solute transporter Ostalpha-domain-containing protein n=1 Tax=Coniella lustricola TaxID=2025994 RepID=A0A2T2ZXA3_9PEZI|nr:organic solute transporter Ostalpha-domain-containing protein [Coniella lustricola]
MGLFNKGGSSSSASSNHTCPTLSLAVSSTTPIAASWTFHQLNVVLSGAAVAFSCLSILVLMANHAMHLSKPKEQLKIMRISLFFPVYGILCFLCVVAPQAYNYLHPWTDLAEAVALGNFFLLLCELLSPGESERDTFFAALDVPATKSRRGRRQSRQDGLTWYRKKWIAVFQFIPVSLLVDLFTCITAAANVYCMTSNKPYFAHLWLNIAHLLSLAIAIIAVLGFYKLLKPSLAGHKPLAKLLAFKLLIGLNFLLTIIFTVLNGLSDSPLAPTQQLSYSDVTVGIPMLVNCLLMVPFSLFFHYAYDVTPYYLSSLAANATLAQKLGPDANVADPEAQPMNSGLNSMDNFQVGAPITAYQGGPLGLKAWIWVWNPTEIIHALLFSVTMMSATGRSGRTRVAAGVYASADAAPPAGDAAMVYANSANPYSANQPYKYDQPQANNNSSASPPDYGQYNEGRVSGYSGVAGGDGGAGANPGFSNASANPAPGPQSNAYGYPQQHASQGHGTNTAYHGAGAQY